jgi:hypothetical protein
MGSRTVGRIAWSLREFALALLVGGSSQMHQRINPQLGHHGLLRCPRLSLTRPLLGRRLVPVKLEHKPTGMADRFTALGGSLEALSSTSSGQKILDHGRAPESTS